MCSKSARDIFESARDNFEKSKNASDNCPGHFSRGIFEMPVTIFEKAPVTKIKNQMSQALFDATSKI